MRSIHFALSTRLIVNACKTMRWPPYSTDVFVDITGAFLYGDLQEELYMELPASYKKPLAYRRRERHH